MERKLVTTASNIAISNRAVKEKIQKLSAILYEVFGVAMYGNEITEEKNAGNLSGVNENNSINSNLIDAEVNGSANEKELDKLIRNLSSQVYRETGYDTAITSGALPTGSLPHRVPYNSFDAAKKFLD